jgi:hypothetical protein
MNKIHNLPAYFVRSMHTPQQFDNVGKALFCSYRYFSC